jgi:hypothetical protein
MQAPDLWDGVGEVSSSASDGEERRPRREGREALDVVDSLVVALYEISVYGCLGTV